MKYLFLACGMAALFAACQNENEPQETSKPGTSGDYRIVIEGDETASQPSRASGTVQFVGGTASGAGLYDGNGRAFVSATPDAGYEIEYFYGGPDSEPRKYDNANGGATSFDVPIGGQDHLFHVGFKEKKGFLTVNAGTGGSVSPSGEQEYQQEKPISVRATPNSGYQFTGWSVSGNVTVANTSSASTTATLHGSSGTITANFSQKTITEYIYLNLSYSKSTEGIEVTVSANQSPQQAISISYSFTYSIKNSYGNTTYGPQTVNDNITLSGNSENRKSYTLNNDTWSQLYIDSAPSITSVSPTSFTIDNTEYIISW